MLNSEQLASQPAWLAAPPAPILALFVSMLLVAASFAWQGSYGFYLEDEGYLWYGAQRVLAGEIPILDFSSYDPGRYYWSAALMTLLHNDGIITLRYATAAFQAIGLFVALLLLLGGKRRADASLFIMAAITLLVWMYPRHKLFDVSLSIFLVWLLTYLVQQPSRLRFFLVGVGVGLVAVFGRNHGVYGVAGILGATIYLACGRVSARVLLLDLACCAAGVTVGFLPILFMIGIIPGFAAAFWDSIRGILERGATNLPLPVVWPWLVPVKQLPPAEAAAGLLTGAFFVALPLFAIVSIGWVISRAVWQKAVSPELVACSALTLPYAQYAFSRADISHLSQGIFPCLIGAFIFLKDCPLRVHWGIALAVMVASLTVMLQVQPGWLCRVESQCVAVDIAGDTLQVSQPIASTIAMLRTVIAQYAPDGRNFVTAPQWPGAYALLRRKSPMWDIYALLPRSAEFQRKEIERIKAARPGLVLILDVSNDGRDDLRFRNTHPLIEQFIRENFDAAAVAGWPPPIYQFYKAR